MLRRAQILRVCKPALACAIHIHRLYLCNRTHLVRCRSAGPFAVPLACRHGYRACELEVPLQFSGGPPGGAGRLFYQNPSQVLSSVGVYVVLLATRPLAPGSSPRTRAGLIAMA